MMNYKKFSAWDYIAWGILVFIVLWLILKVVGVINTPLWLEYSPLFGAVYLAGWAMSKLDRVTDDIKEVKDEIKSSKDEILFVKTEVENIKEKCSQFDCQR
ncbi:hypothetical protein HZC30_04795 [Candidatus Woesearchaeota archaeon]|nr:hypothetical protein [Candidatus Woesearchaeota archaeon]